MLVTKYGVTIYAKNFKWEVTSQYEIHKRESFYNKNGVLMSGNGTACV